MPFLSAPIGPVFVGILGITLAADSFFGRVVEKLYFDRGEERTPWLRGTFVSVALAVFVLSVAAQMFFIYMTHPSFAEFFSMPRRTDMFLVTTGINLVNAIVAGLLARRAKLKEQRWQAHHDEVTGYLNHHVRNGLTAIQLAASCTKDQRVVGVCNESVQRIVKALVTAENGIPQDDEFLKFQNGERAAS